MSDHEFSFLGIGRLRVGWRSPSPAEPDLQGAPAPGSRKTVALVTMVYNEPDFLPTWISYYGAQVGQANCYIVDHSSNVETTSKIPGGMHSTRLPRTPLDEGLRASLISTFCNMLLSQYETVIYTDVDEFLVVDSRKYLGLVDFCRRNTQDVVTVFGADVVQMPDEMPLTPRKRLLSMRSFARPFAALCKPLIIRRRIAWAPGFHYADSPSVFSDVVMLHLAYADAAITRRRQEKRTATPRTFPQEGSHHSMSPDDMVRHIARDYAQLPREQMSAWDDTEAAYRSFMDLLRQDGNLPSAYHSYAQSSVLWPIPEYLKKQL